MSRVVIVHGTGAPPRDDASVRVEWVTSIWDGLALAGVEPGMCAEAAVEVINLDVAVPVAAPSPEVDEWMADVARRCLAIARFDAPRPAIDGSDVTAVLEELAFSRYFTGLTVEDVRRAFTVLHQHLHGAADMAVRRAIGDEPAVVIGFSLGNVAALRVLAAATAGSHRLITVGAPLGLAADANLRRWDLLDRYDTLAHAAGPATAGRTVMMDCDPRIRAVRQYVAAPEFGRALAAELTGRTRMPLVDVHNETSI